MIFFSCYHCKRIPLKSINKYIANDNTTKMIIQQKWNFALLYSQIRLSKKNWTKLHRNRDKSSHCTNQKTKKWLTSLQLLIKNKSNQNILEAFLAAHSFVTNLANVTFVFLTILLYSVLYNLCTHNKTLSWFEKY